MAIRFFDMFAGIGGFRSGLEAVGGFECIGHCEIDKKANQAYNAIYQPKGEIYFEDATKIDTNDLPDIDLICAGFPCQSFSVAGKRLGFRDDTRGTLFFEVARIAEAKRPPLLLLENVPGLLSHDGGRTLFTIFSTLVELGYSAHHIRWLRSQQQLGRGTVQSPGQPYRHVWICIPKPKRSLRILADDRATSAHPRRAEIPSQRSLRGDENRCPSYASQAEAVLQMGH